LQNPSQINGDNLNNIRHETCGTFRKKKRDYLREKYYELETNSNDKNVRELSGDMNEFKPGFELACLVAKIFSIEGRITSIGYWTYIVLMMLGREKCM